MNNKIPLYSERKYNEKDCCVFRKTKEKFGGLSNMASGFPLKINSIQIYSSEGLYQACRFPHLPYVQEIILTQKSPMIAKMKSKPHRKQTRDDWELQKIRIMQWCLRVKLAQNFLRFGLLLEETYYKPIVEDSAKDGFWGAKRQREEDNILIGINALGRLLMELRENYFSVDRFKLLIVDPPKVDNFLLFDEVIPKIDERENFISQIRGTQNAGYTFSEIEPVKSIVKESQKPKLANKQKKIPKKNLSNDISLSLFNEEEF